MQQSSEEQDNVDHKKILSEFKDLVQGDGHVNNFTAKIKVSETAIPRIAHAWPVPFAWKNEIDAKYDRLIATGILEPVDTSTEMVEWASPVVIEMQVSGKTPICTDFKNTINPFIVVHKYPLPTFEEAVSKLSRCFL